MAKKYKVSIGDTIYQFDPNTRVYRRDEKGRGIGGPIFSEHFIPYIITGEEKQSWVLSRKSHPPDFSHKVSKNKVEKQYYTEKEKEDTIWLNSHRYQISKAVERCRDVEKMRQISEILGYEEGADD